MFALIAHMCVCVAHAPCGDVDGVVFGRIDVGQDNTISFAEFHAGLRILGMRMDEEECKQEFSRIDRDGSGKLTFEEFCQWLRTM